MNLMEKYLARMTTNKGTNERPNKPISPHETGLSIQTEAVYCSWLQKDVPKNECFKPLSCFHRDENNQ